ncbi:hypothetical protein [Rhodovulum steppense]|uniref:Uncharacterized protein n=1 Tax=Rhodovulum steppense TaxID=540251 RepID=A0A4R1YM57_9RHOB|nr:hypothetical protein [Rhodovulum steppense]TCM78347.1 hypothetical protein EV216_12624 [Rhodovulum steppense]
MADKKNDQLIDDPTPLSSRFNWPLLSSRKSAVNLAGVGPTPFSSALGLSLLSSRSGAGAMELRTGDPTPFSSRFNWPLLSERRGNVELSTGDSTPLSSKLNLPLLSDRATVAGGEVSGGGSGLPDGAFGRFIRQIITGEVQK